ncbi:STAS domain-containing protein [Capillimicrobium parvum]|uniref:Anti-sigma factor antagonist n=1 Tax=Capillimicrobium parvum TaxID=2884022 RepID=A0A9E7C1M5_9ACTN|nr:STAS domain-containing protein [Capillimicrobium parvum]UGS36583.1 Putative anti-sigma factor antagonist [Capillimicrobium parvum]
MPPDAEPFSLSLSHADGVAVVAVHGTVDLYTARELRGLLNDTLPRSRGTVLLDLSESTFVDSSGLAALIAAHRRARRDGGLLVVVNRDREIARLLEVTGLDSLLSVAADRREAIDLLRPRRRAAGG